MNARAESELQGDSLQCEPSLVPLLPRVREYTTDKTIEWLQRLARKAIYIYELFTFCFVSLKAVSQSCRLLLAKMFGVRGEICEPEGRWRVCSRPSTVGLQEQQNMNKLDRFVEQIPNYATWLQHEIFLIENKWVLSDVRKPVNWIMNDSASPKRRTIKEGKLFRSNVGSMHYVSPQDCEVKNSMWFTFCTFCSPAALSL